MATGKRYYWIKLKDSFFTSDTVDFFMGQEGGANYIVLYQMLQLMTANTEGRLQRRIGEIIIPYDVAKIKRDCKWFSEDTIRVAMELYKQFGLIYEDSDGVLVMTDHEKMVGSETDYAQQKRIQRENEKLLKATQSYAMIEKGSVDTVHDNVHSSVFKNVHTDIRDKILDKDINNICIEDQSSTQENTSKVRKRKSKLSGKQKELFDKFYSAYPKKRSVGEAEKAWMQITPDPTDDFVERLINSVRNKQESGEWSDFQYIPFPASWLRGRGWEDDTDWVSKEDSKPSSQTKQDWWSTEMQFTH